MVTPNPETTRIRWEPTQYGGWTGGTGTLDGWLFQVWKAPAPVGPWRLESGLPGNFGRIEDGRDPDELKAEAERWLAEFVSSLGAVFCGLKLLDDGELGNEGEEADP